MSGLLRAAPIAIPDRALDDLHARLAATRWPEREPVGDGSQGARLAGVQALCAYWRERYDWRRCESMLNGWNPLRTEIDGLGIHLFHIRSPEPGALPVVMTHGWPGSVVEFPKVVGPLTAPRAPGGAPGAARPRGRAALAGYGFSGKPAETGWSLARIAGAWSELMHRLGYRDRWAAQGGDWGAQVTSTLASRAPAGCIGIHLNGHAWQPTDAEKADADPYEQMLLARMIRFERELSGYMKEQGTRPQTVGYGLGDSPAGQAAWIYEKYCDWADHESGPETLFSMDEMLDNIMLYWITNTAASSARLYWKVARAGTHVAPVELPVAFSQSPRDIGGPSRRWAGRRFKRIVHWREVAHGGHFAAFEQPAIFVDEVRAGFRAVRAAVK